jgi:hypothetical protein
VSFFVILITALSKSNYDNIKDRRRQSMPCSRLKSNTKPENGTQDCESDGDEVISCQVQADTAMVAVWVCGVDKMAQSQAYQTPRAISE